MEPDNGHQGTPATANPRQNSRTMITAFCTDALSQAPSDRLISAPTLICQSSPISWTLVGPPVALLECWRSGNETRNIVQAAALTCSLCFGLSAQSDTVPRGTEITVRTNDSIEAKPPNEGKIYSAVVDRDVQDRSGHVIIPRGSTPSSL